MFGKRAPVRTVGGDLERGVEGGHEVPQAIVQQQWHPT